jgi:hypothetical protein
MTPTPLIQLGTPIELEQNVIYALPARRHIGFVSITNSDLEVNTTNHTNSGWEALTITDQNFETAAPFIRTTTGDIVINCKA